MKSNICNEPKRNLRPKSAALRWRLVKVVGLASLSVLLANLCLAQSTVTVTSVPADGATGVSASAPVVFTFSAPMSTSFGTAIFQTPPSTVYGVTTAWSAGNTVLTCTPLSPFPSDTTISWMVVALDGSSMPVTASGSFTTGTGGGGGGSGSGTNAFTTFSAGKLYFFDQLTAGAPTPNPDDAYALFASASLASNVAATAVSVTVPGASTPNSLNQNPVAHEDYSFFAFSTNQASFEATYPQGNYGFNVTATTNNLSGTVTLPMSMVQPNAPHVTDFAAAQTIDVTQAFKLTWDAFQNGTASDFISVSLTDDLGKTVFATPGPGTNGALNGLATSVTIPVNKLTTGITNTTQVIFYRFVGTTNSSYAAVAYRATGTQLNLVTGGSVVVTTPVVSNATWGAGGFGFDVATSINQSLEVLYSTDLVQWQQLYTTNSPGTSVHISVSTQLGANAFFRVKNLP